METSSPTTAVSPDRDARAVVEEDARAERAAGWMSTWNSSEERAWKWKARVSRP
jgi:hypothetical protein